MKIKTNRLIIRYFEVSDIDDFYEFSSQKEVGYTAGWKPHDSYSQSKRILWNKMMSLSNFAIVLKEENKVIGSIELNPSHIRKGIKAYEIGFALNTKYWGFGYAKEASEALIEYAFKKEKAYILEMCHIIDNYRSEKTILSLGFKYEGTLRAYKEMYDKRIIDVKLYSMTKNDYERMNNK